MGTHVGSIVVRASPARIFALYADAAGWATWEPDRAFDAEARLPGCIMRFEHELEPRGPETHVTHRVVFTGPLTWLFGWLIGRQIDRGMDGTLAGLKRAAEPAD
jgi:hypothetical protein